MMGGHDTVYTYGGNDVVIGGRGNDEIHGGSGDDVLNGNAGDDKIYGDSGNDELNGGAGIDNLYGGADHDNITGGDGNDSLYGDGGNDRLTGDAGNDYLWGGPGDDTYVHSGVNSGGDGFDTIGGFDVAIDSGGWQINDVIEIDETNFDFYDGLPITANELEEYLYIDEGDTLYSDLDGEGGSGGSPIIDTNVSGGQGVAVNINDQTFVWIDSGGGHWEEVL